MTIHTHQISVAVCKWKNPKYETYSVIVLIRTPLAVHVSSFDILVLAGVTVRFMSGVGELWTLGTCISVIY